MVDKIKLPIVIPNKLLISPGNWNDNEYSSEELGNAFAKTDWQDKTKISLWLNHDDTNTGAFVGYVKNPTLASEGRVFGDLEIWDEKTALILTQAKAKFGVSAKIKGEEDKTGKMNNFTFENFSVVTVPACSEAYINLSKKEEDSKLTSKYLSSDEFDKNIDEMVGEDNDFEYDEEYDEDKELSKDKSHSHTIERGLENMKENKIEENKEVIEELSEKEMLKELSSKFDKLISLLSKKELAEEPAEESKEEVVEEVVEEAKEEPVAEEKVEEAVVEEPKVEEAPVVEKESELSVVKKELAEMKEQMNKPKSKTIRNLSSNTVSQDAKFDINEFCGLLGAVDRPLKFN